MKKFWGAVTSLKPRRLSRHESQSVSLQRGFCSFPAAPLAALSDLFVVQPENVADSWQEILAFHTLWDSAGWTLLLGYFFHPLFILSVQTGPAAAIQPRFSRCHERNSCQQTADEDHSHIFDSPDSGVQNACGCFFLFFFTTASTS